MGSGKTHWGRLLAAAMHLPFFDLDSVITSTENKSVSDIFSEKGEEYFRYKEKEVLEELVSDHPAFILSTGGGTPCFFNSIEFMKKNGTVVWLNTPAGTLRKRLLKERMSRPLIRSVGETQLKNFIIRKLGERKMYYEQAHVIVNDDEISTAGFIELLKQHE
jgi:shikimate kinase